MRLSQHFGRTLREAPSDASMTSHALIVRAGLARPLSAGIWTYLPLGYRVIRRLEQIIREEMNATGSEEMRMPVLHPAEIWQATGRWSTWGPVLVKVTNREGREFVLGATHEEVVVDLCLREIKSYKDLPRSIYQFQTKERDEPRARGGLLRLREFLMKDAYSMHTNANDLDRTYEKIYQAYLNVFQRCDVDVIPVEADTGLMGGSGSHEFVLPHPIGEDRFVRCSNCDYAANVEAATFNRRSAQYGDPLPLEKVATPDCKTIADLCAFLNILPQQTLKAVFYSTDEGNTLVLAMLRGDLDVSEVKLANALGGASLEPASEEMIAGAGAVAGYGSPVGLAVCEEGGTTGVVVVADLSLKQMTNFVTGANEAGFHVINANWPRDFTATQVADIAEPFDGANCAHCGGALRIESAIEMGHCFKLGTRYSQPVDATYLDENGEAQLIVMGSYGIGLDRLLAAIVETHHDEHGIIWPREVAPYAVHLIAIARDEDTTAAANEFYDNLIAGGIETLYDDRNLSPGVMFADADLLGLPLRVTVSRRSLQNGGVEVKWRDGNQPEILPLEEAIGEISTMLN